MANLLEMLQGQLGPEMIAQLAKQIGAEPEQTSSAISGILPALIGGLSKNAASTEGANALSNALEKDHDGGGLSDLMGMFTNAMNPQDTGRSTNGLGILQHILGEKQGGIAQMVAQMSGLNTNSTSGLMASLAPMVMGLLGQQKKSSGLDASGIASLLTNNNQQMQQQASQNPAMGFITQMLDADGDGSMIDDIAGKVGKSILGNLFK